MDFQKLNEPMELLTPLSLASEFDCLKNIIGADCSIGTVCNRGKE